MKFRLFSPLKHIKQMFSLWGFWNFCFQFVSFDCFCFLEKLTFSTLQFGSRFSRRASWCSWVLASSWLQQPRLCLCSSASVVNDDWCRTSRLPSFQGASAASWILGFSGTLHLLGCGNGWRCHRRVHHRLCGHRLRRCPDLVYGCPRLWRCDDIPETAEGSALQEWGERCVRAASDEGVLVSLRHRRTRSERRNINRE